MNTYRIAFIGHRKIDGRFRFQPRLDAIIKEMITRKVRLEFYVGCEGAFDTLVTTRVKMIKEALGSKNSRLVLIPLRPIMYDPIYKTWYDEILCPIEWNPYAEDVITKRNQWMINHVDMLISYAEPDRCKEAMTALKYAETKTFVKTINLAQG